MLTFFPTEVRDTVASLGAKKEISKVRILSDLCFSLILSLWMKSNLFVFAIFFFNFWIYFTREILLKDGLHSASN